MFRSAVHGWVCGWSCNESTTCFPPRSPTPTWFFIKQAAAIGKLLRDSSPGVVAAAAYVLTGMGPAAADYVSALEAALANDKDGRRSLPWSRPPG